MKNGQMKEKRCKKIQEAFIELYAKEIFSQISVKELCDKLEISWIFKDFL